MHNRILVSTVITSLLLAGCASRTKTQSLNEDVQTIMLLGTNKIGHAVNGVPTTTNENFKTVRVSISGVVTLAEKCQFNAFHTHYLIELRRINSTQTKASASTGLSENLSYRIDENVNPGEYTLNFIYYRQGKILQSIPLKIDDEHDRFTFNFNGCP